MLRLRPDGDELAVERAADGGGTLLLPPLISQGGYTLITGHVDGKAERAGVVEPKVIELNTLATKKATAHDLEHLF